MPDKIELKIEISFFVDCDDNNIEKIKQKLEDLGWFICQETNVKKAIANFPDAKETGYDVVVKEVLKDN